MNFRKKTDQYKSISKAFRERIEDQITLSDFYLSSYSLLDCAIQLLKISTEEESKTKDSSFQNKIRKLQFDWSIEVLDLGIYFRDFSLKLTKQFTLSNRIASQTNNSSDTLVLDGGVFKKSIDILKITIAETSENLNSIFSQDQLEKDSWLKQKSPESEVSKQLTEILSQLKLIKISFDAILPLKNKLDNYREHLLECTNSRLIKLRKLEYLLGESFESIHQLPDKCAGNILANLSTQLKKTAEQVDLIKHDYFSHEKFKFNVKPIKVPISVNNGLLVYKEVNFNQSLETWVDGEIFPTIIDADADTDILADSSVIMLFNTRNKIESLLLAEKAEYEINKQPFELAIKDKIKEISDYKLTLDNSIYQLNHRTQTELRIENLYDDKRAFLPELDFISLTRMTGQKIWYEEPWLDYLKNQVSRVVDLKKIPYIASFSQGAFQFIESKLIDNSDMHTNSLFLKKGYLGRSFFKERKEVSIQLENGIRRWKNGYQGSALILGSYGSGKTSFIDFIPTLISDITVIKIDRNSILSYNGRKCDVTNNLADAINFLAKQSIQGKIVVSIDDLESWQSEESTLYDNVRALVDGIAKYGKRIFFVVSTNKFMLKTIERLFNFKSRFCEVISLDKMLQSDIANAVVIRHNASLKEHHTNPTSNEKLMQKASKLAKLNHYNVGSTMIHWERFQEGRELSNSIPMEFSVLIKKHKLLLRMLLAYRQVHESNLRYFFSVSDNAFISEEMRKLSGYKIIERTRNGYIQINPFIIFDVENCLNQNLN